MSAYESDVKRIEKSLDFVIAMVLVSSCLMCFTEIFLYIVTPPIIQGSFWSASGI